jgi:4'-phosphopantetheinyl transferase
MFLLGRVMTRALVGRSLGVEPTDWTWQLSRHGRPEISAAATPLSFNLAHSAGVVVCALSRDGAVGADVEHRQRRETDLRMVRRFCSPAEIADVERQGPARWRDQFLRYWTLKEAYLKARGLGIAVHLSDVSFTLGDQVRVEFLNSLAGTDANWAFALAEVGDSHFIAAAAPTIDGVAPAFLVEPLPTDLLP